MIIPKDNRWINNCEVYTNGLFTDSYIYAWDGSEYVLHVNDIAKVNAFCSANPQLYTDAGKAANAGSFADGTTLFSSYQSVYKSAKGQMDANATHDFAMAKVMEEYGISLLKKGADGNFKEMDVTKTTDASGKTTYTLTKCK